ncbi:MAG: Penicillin acylase (Penicillin amidase) [uncultured Rubrobacteraceae bacterium]|uniref:Penicillin acylase (Penicillin amidase) n=1 Tax=uncultured Rubrobacteraceae bacterium TaxID=349277 RepID=A0A6J4R3S5_9ACTN|nr:MAG: Penicillin acylase (Penicillin amidase) [uncultured Rubrobacteraceae bacterium]
MAPDSISYAVSGPRAPVEILIDRWGVPHVYASSSYDAFFAQGFNAARDRLWQIDLWRRRGLGLLSEVFGPSFVEKDRATRLFLYRGEMRSEWLAYGPDTRRVVTAFVSGVNEYVRLVREDSSLLPEEFILMGYRPSFWSPEDVARIRSHGLYQNLASEVERALVLRDFGPEVEALRKPLEPSRNVAVPEGLDLSLIPTDVLRVYELATEPVEFTGGQPLRASGLEGSNNWAISPERTSTGRPILANDPHRAQSVPSLRYAVHLSAPGMDVIGAGEPALPGVSIGHNGKIAFGLTIFSIDQEDLYVYQTNPEAPSEYRCGGRWEPMEVEHQRIPVRDGEPAEVELGFTRHGPVIYEDPKKNVAFAVRAAWLEPGMAPYLGSLNYMRAGDWDEFLAAMERWGTPGENLVYADVRGNIGWKPAGLVPRRSNWDGLLPVPGDGRYEWDGFLDADELPAEFNPPRGWVASANEMNLPGGYPHEEKKVGFEWYAPQRYQRIAEVLRENPSFGLEDSVKLQTDYLSVPARRIVTRLRSLRPADPKVEQALKMLTGWDCVLRADSAPAALFEVWYRLHLRETLLTRAMEGIVEPGRLAEAMPRVMQVQDQAGDARMDLEILEKLDARLGPEAVNEAMSSTLREATERLERLLGADWGEWEWGKLHHAFLAHPLSPLVERRTRSRLDVGPAPRGGSGDTVGNTAYRLEDFRQTGGSSWRVVVDVGGWDNSLMINSPGQSGDPASPHYSDLFHPWARDEAVPLLYSRRKVEAATEVRIVLEPKAQ